MLVYNYDTEYTRVANDDNFFNIRAYTDKVNTKVRKSETVVHEPDHLLVARDTNVVIPHLTNEDVTLVIPAEMSTIMDSYSLEIDSLEGLENISAIDVYMTGHSSSNRIGPNVRSSESVTLYIPCYVDMNRYCLYTEFNTFGRLSDEEGYALIHITVSGAGGTVYDWEEDISDQYNNPDHRLRVVIHGKIKPRDQGGFVPTVDEWEKKIKDIEIM